MKTILTFIVFIVVMMLVCNTCMNSINNSGGSSSNSSSSYNSISEVPVEYWRSHAYITDLEKEKRAYVSSNVVTSDSKMDFPYTNTTAQINVVKNNRSTWAYIEFSNPPNIVNAETEDGYNVIRADVYIDAARETATLNGLLVSSRVVRLSGSI